MSKIFPSRPKWGAARKPSNDGHIGYCRVGARLYFVGLAEAQAPKVGTATFNRTDFPVANQYVGLVKGNRQVTVATKIADRVLRVDLRGFMG